VLLLAPVVLVLLVLVALAGCVPAGCVVVEGPVAQRCTVRVLTPQSWAT
jgi:hypothetical protein